MGAVIDSVALNRADLVLLGLILVFALAGLKAGFVKMTFRVGSFFAAMVAARLFCTPLSAFVKGTDFYAGLMNKISLNAASSQAADGISEGAAKILSMPTEYIAGIVVRIISFAVILIAVKLILFAAERILRLFTALPVVGFINRAAGFILGGAEGLLVVLVILALIYAFLPMQNTVGIDKAISKPGLTSLLYNNNPLLYVIGKTT